MGIRSLLRNAFGRSRATGNDEPTVPEARGAEATTGGTADAAPTATAPVPAQSTPAEPASASPQPEKSDSLLAAFDSGATEPAPQQEPAARQDPAAEGRRADARRQENTAPAETPGADRAAAPADTASAAVPAQAASPDPEPEAAEAAQPEAPAVPAQAKPVEEPRNTQVPAQAEPTDAEPAPAASTEQADAAAPDAITEPEAAAGPEPVTTAEPGPVSEPVAADAQASETVAAAEPEDVTTPEPVTTPAAVAAPAAEPEVAAEPEPAPEAAATAEPEAAVTPAPEAVVATEPEAAPEPAAATDPGTAPEPEPLAAPEPEAAAVPDRAEPVTAEPTEAQPVTAEPVAAEPVAHEAAAAAAAAPVGSAGALSLTKIEESAPGLVSLYKSAGSALGAQGLTGTRAAVYLVLDRSGSMRRYYKDGTVQHLAEQTLALSAHLDDDGTVPVVFFSTDIDGTADVSLDDYSGRIETLHSGLGHMGRTNYHRAIETVVEHYQKSGTTAPAFVIFQTDGAPTSKPAAEKAICEAAGLPIFWQFIGFGEPDAKGFDFLRKLDVLTVPDRRPVDNAGFFSAGADPLTVADAELYSRLTADLPQWLTEARAAGILR
ncbi:VWA domain-containing protein [Streptomyces sp. bgisy100]|uniref:vWA domain-containing protein n=1 Tax=Streptomyces sp. bgisy100 TaxID=3413783 RepID=UPI003D71E2ED